MDMTSRCYVAMYTAAAAAAASGAAVFLAALALLGQPSVPALHAEISIMLLSTITHSGTES
jgi:hypothetical protein